MCRWRYNKCTEKNCDIKEKLTGPPELCQKAKDRKGEPCKTFSDPVTVDKKDRQMCKAHAKKSELYLPHSRTNTDQSKRSKRNEDDAGLSESQTLKRKDSEPVRTVAQMAIREKTSSDSSSRPSSKPDPHRAVESAPKPSKGKEVAVEMQREQSNNSTKSNSSNNTNKSKKMLKGYTDNYRNMMNLKPVELLAPEADEWQEWRQNLPSQKPGHPDSRGGRYNRAMQTHMDRAWPLPYESFPYYVNRQIKVLKRSMNEHERFKTEYEAWCFGDQQFFSEDTRFLNAWLKSQIVVADWYKKWDGVPFEEWFGYPPP